MLFPHPLRFSPHPHRFSPHPCRTKLHSLHLTIIRSWVCSSALYKDTHVYCKLNSNLVYAVHRLQRHDRHCYHGLSPAHSPLPRQQILYHGKPSLSSPLPRGKFPIPLSSRKNMWNFFHPSS